jgi:hypothetical protein
LPAAFDAVAPIFLLVALGALASWRGVLEPRGGEVLSAFAARIGIPFLIFDTLLHADLAGFSPWRLWGAYFPAAGLSWAIGHTLVQRVFGREPREAVIAGVGSAFANSAFVGLPLAERVYGTQGVIIVTILISIHLPVMLTAATLLMERAERITDGSHAVPAGRLALQVLRSLATNPIVLAIALAMVLRLGGVALPAAAGQAVAAIARSAGPVALVALGAGLVRTPIGEDLAAAATVSAMKLLAMPALVWIAGRIAGLEPTTLGPLVVLAGVPAGVNVHLVAVQYRVGQALGAAIVVMTTVAGALTSTFWLALLP